MTVPTSMLEHLAHAARAARRAAEASTLDVAAAARVDAATVRRFERARAWPRDPDALIAAYARASRCSSKTIWRDAVNSWR